MIQVAVVDGSDATREVLKAAVDLTDGCECVCVCKTGEEAIRNFPKQVPSVVLMDIELAGITGIECLRRLKRSFPELQVIIHTDHDDPSRIFDALRAGASGYVLKRSSADEAMAAVREVSRGGGFLSGEIASKVVGYFNAQSDTQDVLGTLTLRERGVLDRLGDGLSNKEIAERLSISVDAVRWHLKHIYMKLGVHSRTEAALKLRNTWNLAVEVQSGWMPLAKAAF